MYICNNLKYTILTPSATASLSVYIFSLHYPCKISCLVMRIKQMIIHSKLSKMKDKTLRTCLQGNFRDSSREFGKMSYGLFGADRVKT